MTRKRRLVNSTTGEVVGFYEDFADANAELCKRFQLLVTNIHIPDGIDGKITLLVGKMWGTPFWSYELEV